MNKVFFVVALALAKIVLKIVTLKIEQASVLKVTSDEIFCSQCLDKSLRFSRKRAFLFCRSF